MLFARDDEAKAALKEIEGLNLAELFIVSACTVSASEPRLPEAVMGKGENLPGLSIYVHEAAGQKCPRCWMHSEAADPETGLCPRCAAVLAQENAQ